MLKKSKKIALITSAIAPVVISSGLGLASCTDPMTMNITTEHLLSFNDLHAADVGYGDPDYCLPVSSKNPGIERIANTVRDFKQENPYTILLSAGDNASSDAFGSWNQGEEVFKLNKALDVRYSAVGNHAWEWGHDLTRFENLAKPDDEGHEHYFITSNVLGDARYQDKTDWVYDPSKPGFAKDYSIWNDMRLNAADPYRIVNIHGHPICLIGLTTQGTRTDGNKKYVPNLSFIDYKAAVNFTKYFARQDLGEEEYSKIESFVLLTHVESYFDGKPEDDEKGARKLAAEIDTDVDAIISAHSHKKGAVEITNPTLHKNIWVGQADTAGRALLDTQLTFNDDKPVGQKLVNVKMEVKDVPIDFGGYDPKQQPEEALAAARRELENIRHKAAFLSNNDPLKKTVQQFNQSMSKTLNFFKEAVCEHNTSTGEKYPWCERKDALGHAYIWPSNSTELQEPEKFGQPDIENLDNNYLVEEIGGWISYNQLRGFADLQKYEEDPVEPAAIGMGFFDSIAGCIDAGSKVVRGHAYQMLPYDNSMVYGTITLGQLCNIIDYLLAGEDAFVYGEQNNNNYLSDARYEESGIDKDHGLNYDPFTKQPCVLTQEGEEPTVADSKYLAAPLQFWGMRFDVERYDAKLPDEEGKPDRWTRRFRLKWIGDQPQVKIYDYKDPEQDLTKPDTWKVWDKDRLIPIIFDSFDYAGGNGQCRMLKPYIDYCLKNFPEQANLVQYTDLSRDWLLRSLGLNNTDEEMDVTKDQVKKLVTFLERE